MATTYSPTDDGFAFPEGDDEHEPAGDLVLRHEEAVYHLLLRYEEAVFQAMTRGIRDGRGQAMIRARQVCEEAGLLIGDIAVARARGRRRAEQSRTRTLEELDAMQQAGRL